MLRDNLEFQVASKFEGIEHLFLRNVTDWFKLFVFEESVVDWIERVGSLEVHANHLDSVFPESYWRVVRGVDVFDWVVDSDEGLLDQGIDRFDSIVSQHDFLHGNVVLW